MEEEGKENAEISIVTVKDSDTEPFDPSYIHNLLNVVENNDTKEALSLLELQDRVSTNHIGSYGLSLLQWASYHGNEKVECQISMVTS